MTSAAKYGIIYTVIRKSQIIGQAWKGGTMDNMTYKEFDLFLSLILELLKQGQTDKVIELLEKAKSGDDK